MIAMDVVVLNALNGIMFGSILFLLASGLSIILGVMGILNLSHGALFMIGGYVGWSVAIRYGLNFGFALGAGAVAAGLVGLVIERGFLRYLYRQLNEQVLLTIGFIYILTNLSLWIWGPSPKPPFAPSFLCGSFEIMGWPYPTVRIGIIITGLVLAVGLWWLQDKTRIGAIIRAGMEDKEMVMGLGINLDRLFTAVFFLGAFTAGLAGVVGAQLLGVNLSLGWEILLYALVVVVIGGMGSVQGAFLGAMLIAFIDTFGKVLFPEYATYTIYLAMIAILLVRPRGLLGRQI